VDSDQAFRVPRVTSGETILVERGGTLYLIGTTPPCGTLCARMTFTTGTRKCGSKQELLLAPSGHEHEESSVEWPKIHQVTRGVRHDVDFPQ
jgi:hypothetical protein